MSNDSCLTSNCHGDRKFMDKLIQLGTVQFTHSKHLMRTEEHEKTNQARLAEIETMLKGQLDEERFKELEAAAEESGPAGERYNRLVALGRAWSVPLEAQSHGGVLTASPPPHPRRPA